MQNTYLSTSLLASLSGSQKNYCAPVSIAKRDDGTHAVIKRVFPNHRVKKLAIGYQRFGCAVVWINKKIELSPAIGNTLIGGKEPMDLVLVRRFAEAAFKAADEVTLLRKTKPII